MEWLKKLEWTGFAAGIVAAMIIWSHLHSFEYRVPKSTDTLASITDEDPSRTTGAETGTSTGSVAPRTRPPAADSLANADTDAVPAAAQPRISVRVYLTGERRIETVPLETYVRGVVAAEMPAGFEPAALQAQALAARTYIVRRLLQHDRSSVPVSGADVTDTQTHQVYRSLEDMNSLRSNNESAWRKADEAAKQTKGKIIVYAGRPIQALYFSASNGYTENSEEVFPASLPYLRSVASPWDLQQQNSGAAQTTEIPLPDFYDKLGIRSIPVGVRLGGSGQRSPKIKVTEWTDGKRIKSLTVGEKAFSGQEIRDLLHLRSASFTWEVKSNKIIITTQGNGHGVGMSQWGAEGMAKAGNTAEQIVKHYYRGVQLMEVSKLAPAVVDS